MKNTQSLRGYLSHDRGRFFSYMVLGVSALSLSLLAGWQGLHRQSLPASLAQTRKPSPVVNPYGPMIVGLGPWARTAAAVAPEAQRTAALETKPEILAEPAPLNVAEAPAAESGADAPQAEIPLPPRRPAELKVLASRSSPPMRQAALAPDLPPAAPPADNRSFFEKIFGGAGAEQPQAPQPSPTPAGREARGRRAQPPAQALAYAPQESGGGLFGGLTNPAAPGQNSSTAVATPTRPGAGTAVYDISAHTVYMPDGTKLEAHSGLGPHLDDPRFVHVRMKGPTPPTVYALSPREALFHGVEALRLTPIGGNSIYGRAGLLAHTYMLGPNGDSNGCVSIRDYNAFLQAYKRGDVRRLVVVARM